MAATVLIAVIVANLLTREMFGYSFATWRFHLRGETQSKSLHERPTRPANWKGLLTLLGKRRDKMHSLGGSSSGNREVPMKYQHALALAVAAGFGLGAVAIEGLHAQAKAPVFLVTEISVTNPDAYGKEFAPKAQASIKAAGGKQIAIGGAGGAGANKVTAVEGAPPKRVVIQVWDSLEKMQAWRNGADYKEARKIGDKYATFRSYAVDGLPQ